MDDCGRGEEAGSAAFSSRAAHARLECHAARKKKEKKQARRPPHPPPTTPTQTFTYPACTADKVVTRFTLPPRCLAFSPTGAVLAAGGDDDGVKLVSPSDATLLRTLPTPAYTRGLAFDPEGEYVAVVGADGGLTVWRADSGAKVAARRHAAPRLDPGGPDRAGVAWHPDGSLLALAAPVDGDDGASIQLIERLAWTPAASRLEGGHPSARAVTSLAFSPNGLFLASGGDDGSIAIWDAPRGVLVATASVPEGVAGVAWAPAGSGLSVLTVDGALASWPAPVPADGPPPSATRTPCLMKWMVLKKARKTKTWRIGATTVAGRRRRARPLHPAPSTAPNPPSPRAPPTHSGCSPQLARLHPGRLHQLPAGGWWWEWGRVDTRRR